METPLNLKKEQEEPKTGQDPFLLSRKGSSFSERLKELIGNKSGRSFAKDAGISYSTLHNYLTDTSLPTLDNLIALANYANVSVQWLATGEYLEESKQKDSTNLTVSNDETFISIEDCRDVRISAGGGGFNDDYRTFNTTKVEKAWLDARRLKADNCAMFLVSGDSMYPTLKDGEEIIVDRSKTDLKDGKIFVLNNERAMLVKKVQITYTGVTLISQNTEYSPIELDAEQASNLIVIGQVVRGYRDF
ncbi:XRE family transcriptional regulator [Rodentibacter caecimuris]|uniref:XRE family transcriptional regulator n=1 Tax=Rodentibacter caecimuris TaxID=1796644 RepID=UPI00258261A0|nr:LexA family transcriptional regulator [Rodentibacter heylii]